MPQKTIPQRMCLGCGEMKPKPALMRVVKTADGQVLADRTGKVNGRGAYVCVDRDCLLKLKKSRRLERTFKMPIGDEVWAALDAAVEEQA